jgi:3-oxoacyl-[acyl-carrier protein] reductase
MDVREKTIVVTGGVRGIGRAVVERLLAEGAVVGVLDRDRDGLEELQKLHGAVRVAACDVCRPDEVGEAVDALGEKAGEIHGLVNNAGVLYSEPLVCIGPDGLRGHDLEAWDRVLASNLSSVFYVTRCVVERMVRSRTRGVVVNVSSVCAAGNPGQSAYAAAKAGVNALTATWAGELSPLRIRVAAVAPGYSDTESTHAAIGKAQLDAVLGEVPARRLGTPKEIADAVLFVLRNDFVNGKVIAVDGGLGV